MHFEHEEKLLEIAFDEIGREDLTIRNIVEHLDFRKDISVKNNESVIYTNIVDPQKVILVTKISYAPRDANPNNAQLIKRPYSITVIRNGNRIVNIQTIKEPNTVLNPPVEIHVNDRVEIIIEGYDSSVNIYFFGLVAEIAGINING